MPENVIEALIESIWILFGMNNHQKQRLIRRRQKSYVYKIVSKYGAD